MKPKLPIQIVHHVSKRQLCDLWFHNPQWENRAPIWWHLLFSTVQS